MSNVTKEGIEVKVGQVWKEIYYYPHGRSYEIISVSHGVVTAVPEQGDALLISISRMHDHEGPWSWKLIKDVP
jgi:hypothetical protein